MERVFIDEWGVSRCACGAELCCDEYGEMPDDCPVCGAELDYSHIDE